MALQTRKPTGLPSWPLLLLAGMEKSGKSWAAAEASTSPLIGATYWISIGEDDPDELGKIGQFDIVQHDGSYNGIISAIREINQLEQQPDAAPTLIVLDSISMIWSMLTDEAQLLANRRAVEKAARQKKPAPDGDVQIGMDLWNKAAGRWRRLMDTLRAHRGPVIATARLSQVTLLDEKGDPTKDKDWKIEGHKTLPYDATVIVQLRSRADRYLTGIRSVTWRTEPEALIPFPAGRTIADVWELLGLSEATDRVHHSPDGAASLAVEEQVRGDLLRRLRAVASDWPRIATWWEDKHGEPITEAADMGALLSLVEQGERTHAEGKARVAAERAAAEAAKPQPLPLDNDTPDTPTAEPVDPAPVEEAPKPVDRAADLRRRVVQQCDRLNYTDRADRLDIVACLVGRPIESLNDLDETALRDVLLRLDRTRSRAELEAALDKETTNA